LTSPYATFVYKSDENGNILCKYDFSKTKEGIPLTTTISSMGNIEFIDGKIFLTQNLNKIYGEKTLENNSLAAILDTSKNVTELSLVKYPNLINYKDLGTSAGFGYQYRRIFDGENFIYSFLYSDTVYKISKDHQTAEKYILKSKYIPQIKINRLKTDDFNKILRLTCEEATYEDLLYDKYRNVYYRFACPNTTVDNNDSYLEIIRSGKKQFSILILDYNFNIIGETLFPEYTYVPTAHFINEDGLYISCSHFKNPNYNDDWLKFQRFELVKE